MHDPERYALTRAVLVLLAASVVRWAAVRPDPPVQGGGADELADHIAATEEAADEEERRGRPLEEGETIDPNRAEEVELDRLPGVGPATAAAILAARDSGVVFRTADDLLVVRGIGPATLERIRPRVDLPGRLPARRRPALRAERAPPGGASRSVASGRDPDDDDRHSPVDVNRADLETLEKLPGIGPALARRIVEQRRLRPFATLADLERVRGIGPATVARLQGMATAGGKR